MMLFDDFLIALALLMGGNNELWGIVYLSFLISGTAVAASTTIGVPLGILIGQSKRFNNWFVVTILNSLMGIPPVVLGLFLYLMFNRSGPLGELRLLLTPTLMTFSQILLTLPIIINITRSSIADVPEEIPFLLKTFGATDWQIGRVLWREGREGVYVAVAAALGRAFSEVGALLIVGGNIRGSTRVLTTAIVTETSKGEFGVAIALGIVLMSMTFTLSLLMTLLQKRNSWV